jgi:CDP-4-dehydro-6-deoxyglucose reductase, E3
VLPGQNVLAAALAAGIPLPHSCREGRCASCKSRLISGVIDYPSGRPPGITPAEVERGEVLLCQARPRSDLSIESRRMPLRASAFAQGSLVSIDPLPLGALRVRLHLDAGAFDARPGQFVELRNPAGDRERLAVVGAGAGHLDVESTPDGSALRQWLEGAPSAGASLRIAGPFDRPG